MDRSSIFTLCILCTIANLAKSQEVCQSKNAAKMQWYQSDKWFAEKDQETSQYLRNIKEDTLDKHQAREKYYEVVTKPYQNACHVLKKIGGFWYGGCGFLDGEKLLCMDSLYHAIQNKTCLVYSFGLADDWDFEVLMAELGCTVHGFDPSKMVKRPSNSYLPNLHFHNIGLHRLDGESSLNPGSEDEEIIRVNTLDTILKDLGDYGKRITYLKVDVEGAEIPCIKQWMKSGVLQFVDQLGIEMHTRSVFIDKSAHKMIYRRFLTFLKSLESQYGLRLAAYNPNLCHAKNLDSQKLYYSLHDILLVKNSN